MSTLEIIHFEGRVKMRADVFVKKRMETFQQSWKNLWVGELGTSPCKPPDWLLRKGMVLLLLQCLTCHNNPCLLLMLQGF